MTRIELAAKAYKFRNFEMPLNAFMTEIDIYVSSVLFGSVTERYDSLKFTPPFRVGRKQKRAILDSNGKEVIVFPLHSEKQAELYCNYLNGKK